MGLKNNYKIERKQGNLFLRSKISYNYPWLRKKLLENKHPDLTYNEVDNLPEEYKTFLLDLFKSVYDSACDEWEDDGEVVNCKLCFYEDTVTEAAELYIDRVKNLNRYEVGKDGGEYPLYSCPDCEKESFVYDNLINNIGFCYSCENSQNLSLRDCDLKFCSRCNMLYRKTDSEICDNCFDDILDRND